MLPLLAWTAASAALTGIALLLHTRVRGFLPEDPPAPGRKRHPRPTPMVGAVPAALTTALLWTGQLPWTAVGVAIAAAVGLLDDLRKERGDGLRWTTKAGVLAAAVGAAAFEFSDLVALDPLGWGILVIAMFALTNATNFLDNTDGVATGLGVTALTVIGGADPASPATWLAGVWLAFLPFNWPRAKLFLGDCGALALGLCVATLAARSAVTPDGLAPLHALAPVAVFALDFVQVISARLWLGYAPWIADRRHLTHLLIARSLPQVLVAPILVAVAVSIAVGVNLLVPRS